MKKRIFALLLVILSLFVFASCNGDGGGDGESGGAFDPNNVTMMSAYAEAQELGFEGTLEEFIELISGKDGAAGKPGADGKDGVGISNVLLDSKGSLIVVLSNGTTIDCGKVVGSDGKDGVDGITPTVEISDDGYWVINGVKTDYKAIGTDGTNGTDGITPTVEISDDGYWVINGVKSEHKAIGTDGVNGTNGTDGVTPAIEISDDGYWVINGVKTDVKAKVEFDESVENPQGLDFFLKDDGTYAVGIGRAKLLSRIVIPSTYKGKAVTEIAPYFGATNYDAENWRVKEIVIPNSVTTICDYAFTYCSSLKSVVIGNSVTSIGNFAFGRCCTLTSIVIPDSITRIGEDAFLECYNLVEVINNSSLNIVAGDSSYGCVGIYAKEVHNGDSKIVNKDGYLFYTYNGVNYLLGYVGDDTDLILPDNYNGEDYEIYQYAFYGCSSLTSVVIGGGITNIGWGAFRGCSAITNLYYKGSVSEFYEINIDSENYSLFSAIRYYYSAEEPDPTAVMYWHFVDGEPRAWFCQHVDVDNNKVCEKCENKLVVQGDFNYFWSQTDVHFEMNEHSNSDELESGVRRYYAGADVDAFDDIDTAIRQRNREAKEKTKVTPKHTYLPDGNHEY
ncbi:MAG: leucine-rich repeat protein, partial [Clostridia bacterium]|nr:leucine-rich repeat protein [Clostridia bacterium]